MQWWYSKNEERWNGPCETRDEAIAEGRCEYDDEIFIVTEAEEGEYDLDLGAYRIIDWLDDANCDLTDPDGDGVFGGISKDVRDDLGEVVKAAITAWAQKHKLSTRAFMFTKQRGAWQLLTKRPQNIEKMLPFAIGEVELWPWPNVWLGTTVEDMTEAEREVERG